MPPVRIDEQTGPEVWRLEKKMDGMLGGAQESAGPGAERTFLSGERLALGRFAPGKREQQSRQFFGGSDTRLRLLRKATGNDVIKCGGNRRIRPRGRLWRSR